MPKRVHGDAPIEVAMEATSATYGGILLDENARPMPDRTLQIYVKESTYQAVARSADRQGMDDLDSPDVPCNVPLQLIFGTETTGRSIFFSTVIECSILAKSGKMSSSSQADQTPTRRKRVPPFRWPKPSIISAGTPAQRHAAPWWRSWADDSRDAAKASINYYDDERMPAC